MMLNLSSLRNCYQAQSAAVFQAGETWFIFVLLTVENSSLSNWVRLYLSIFPKSGVGGKAERKIQGGKRLCPFSLRVHTNPYVAIEIVKYSFQSLLGKKNNQECLIITLN